MSTLALYQEIFKRYKLDYGLCDFQRRLIEYSPGLKRYVQHLSGPLRGRLLEDLFDALIGMEADLEEMPRDKSITIEIQKIRHQLQSGEEVFFSLQVSPYQNGILALVSDVTRESVLEQRITQQRNQLDILSTELYQSRARIDELLHRFVPAPIADQAFLNPDEIKLGGQERQISVLFADVRGFTQISAWLDAKSTMEMLNNHFASIGAAVFSHGGLVTNYAGDMFMAVFNALGDQPDHAERAVKTALEIQSSLNDLRVRPIQGMPFVFDFGIGINSGSAVVGFLGFENRFEYTVIGDTVNVASRLSGIAESRKILITRETLKDLTGAWQVRDMGLHNLRGRNEAISVMEIALEI